MALNIKNPETDRLVHELAESTGESLTEAVTVAVRERLERLRRQRDPARVRAAVADLQEALAALPVLDDRTPEEILGYDEYGLPR